ncbi:hypothetical protein F4780DRAFT_459836 [Xylariomycetidae sp. FL0641]|nr:hypothetical protein F4780DRAFT_459836 [Xylariomycetidae sp. FL0641]
MADPLSVAASILGILAAAGKVVEILSPIVSAVKDAPMLPRLIYSEVVSSRIILSALHDLVPLLAAKHRKRASLIQVDQIIAILSDGVLVFSELEALSPSLPVPGTLITLPNRLQWARKENTLSSILTRLENFKSSISLVLNIIQWCLSNTCLLDGNTKLIESSYSDVNAVQMQQELGLQVTRLISSHQDLSLRLSRLEALSVNLHLIESHSNRDRMSLQSDDTVSIVRPRFKSIYNRHLTRLRFSGNPTPLRSSDNAPIVPSRLEDINENIPLEGLTEVNGASSGAVARKPFEYDLLSSPVYQRATHSASDASFTTSVARSGAWSWFSKFSLGEVSAISVIALPIFASDVANAYHYVFGAPQTNSSTSLHCPISRKSFFHDCLLLKHRLLQIKGFGFLIHPEESDLFQEVRRALIGGIPLFEQYDALQSNLKVVRYWIVDKYWTCLTFYHESKDGLRKLGFNNSDLMSENILTFKKVIRVVDCILDHLLAKGLILPINKAAILTPVWQTPSRIPTSLERITGEFMEEERSYVEKLHDILCDAEAASCSHQPFTGTILDGLPFFRDFTEFQNRLLMNAEVIFRTPLQKQSWDQLFSLHCTQSLGYWCGQFVSQTRLRLMLLCMSDSSVNTVEQAEHMVSRRLTRYQSFLKVLRTLLDSITVLTPPQEVIGLDTDREGSSPDLQGALTRIECLREDVDALVRVKGEIGIAV